MKLHNYLILLRSQLILLFQKTNYFNKRRNTFTFISIFIRVNKLTVFQNITVSINANIKIMNFMYKK